MCQAAHRRDTGAITTDWHRRQSELRSGSQHVAGRIATIPCMILTLKTLRRQHLTARTARRARLPLNATLALCLLAALCSPPAVQAQSRYESAEGYFEDANRRISEGDREGAILQLRNALQLNSNHAPSMLALGKVLLETGKPTDAALILGDALLVGVEPSQVVPVLADAYLGSGQYANLLRQLDPQQGPARLRAEIHAARAQAYLALGQANQAAVMIRSARELEPGNYRLRVAEVTYQLQREDLDVALELSTDLVARVPADTRSWSSHASVLHARGSLEEAAQAYEAALERQPRNVDARVSLVDLYMETGRDGDAAPHIAYLRENYPDEPRATYYSALLAGRSGDAEKEREELLLASQLFAAIQESKIENNPQFLMLAALASYSIGANERTAVYIDRYLALRENDPGALRLKASNLLALDNASGAIRTLLPLQQRSPQDTMTAILLAAAYSEEGNHRKAAELLSLVEEAVPDNPGIVRQLAFTKLNAGEVSEGISTLERLRERYPDQEYLAFQLCVAYLQGNRPDEALALIGSLADEVRARPELLNLRAIAQMRAGNTPEAEASWRELLQRDPESLSARVNLGVLHLQAGELDKALDTLELARQAHPESAQPLTALARVYLMTGDPEAALRVSEQALNIDSDSDTAAWWQVQALMALEKESEAEEVARRFAAGRSDSLPANAILGRTFELVGKPSQALLVYKLMSRLPDNSARDLYRIALMQRRAGSDESAEISLASAVQKDPLYVPARLELASTQLALGKYEEAETTALEQLERTPTAAQPWLYIGESRLARERYDTAASAFRKATDAGAVVWGPIGSYRVHISTGKPSMAEKALREGLALSEENLRVYAALSDLLIREQRWDEADETLTALLDRAPSAIHLNNRAYVRQKLGRYEEAESDARDALVLNSNYASAHDTLGWIMALDGRPLEALPHLREAAARIGSNPSVRFHLASVLGDLGRNREALAELYHLLDAETEFPERQQALELQARLQ
jgi:putative PEP-CTERM system TPR-repeat lipoprotein